MGFVFLLFITETHGVNGMYMGLLIVRHRTEFWAHGRQKDLMYLT